MKLFKALMLLITLSNASIPSITATLIETTLNNDYRATEILLEIEECDINEVDENGNPAVVIAIKQRFTDIVLLFLNHRSIWTLSPENYRKLQQALCEYCSTEHNYRAKQINDFLLALHTLSSIHLWNTLYLTCNFNHSHKK